MAENFVCVRVQSMNGVNLNQFQFEYDLTWMSFFQNAEGRTYVRYGGREDHHPESHLNKQSLLRVMRQTLLLHRDGKVQPDNRYEPVAKSVSTPEQIPPMKRMLAGRKMNCIHCHDVKVAQLTHLRDQRQLRKDMVYSYPSPRRLGIEIDLAIQYQVRSVVSKSAAGAAGIRAGDLIRTIEGQRVLTLADMSRVLDFAPDKGTLDIGLERDKTNVAVKLNLINGWRKSDDPSWRYQSTHVFGPNAGLWGVQANDAQRQQLGLGKNVLALKVTYIHKPWSKSAGLKLNDYIVKFDGLTKDMKINQLHSHLNLNRDWGDTIELVVRRSGKDLKLSMTLPDKPPD